MQQLIDSATATIFATEVTLPSAIFRLVVSMLLGAFVGWERKRKGQVAGVRTFALISMGACLAMLLSIYVPQEFFDLKNGDPGRIAAQVVTGVGFLGGGAMIQQKGSVRGLTTAAGIWVVATIGMAVGVGMYVASIVATALILVALMMFEYWERRVRIGQETKVINLKVHTILGDISPYRKALENHEMHLSTFYIECDYDRNETELSLVVLARRDSDFMRVFDAFRALGPTKTISLSSQIDI